MGLFLSVSLCSCTPPEPAEFRIGLLAVTGERYQQVSGEPSIRGAELAAAEINESGGLTIGGRQFLVKIVVRDG